MPSVEDQLRLAAEWRKRIANPVRAETTAEWYARQATRPPHPDATALFMSPEENARTVAAFLRQRGARHAARP